MVREQAKAQILMNKIDTLIIYMANEKNESNIIIYNTIDGKASVVLYARGGSVWMNQNQLAELFDTSKQTVSYHIINILNERELDEKSVVKDYLTTAADGKKWAIHEFWDRYSFSQMY